MEWMNEWNEWMEWMNEWMLRVCLSVIDSPAVAYNGILYSVKCICVCSHQQPAAVVHRQTPDRTVKRWTVRMRIACKTESNSMRGKLKRYWNKLLSWREKCVLHLNNTVIKKPFWYCALCVVIFSFANTKTVSFTDSTICIALQCVRQHPYSPLYLFA